ncbi:MAG: aminopeptidase [Deltaproteobacteria bacterium]|nr:aminopeptidase [Deltaproteobacteria bacterium]MBW2346093.1 aminopeptidase [Deltaproteobacteria bacterium]
MKSKAFKNPGILIAATLILILFCSGCRMAYIFHVAAGQFRLLNDSIPVEDALKKDSLGYEQKERLRLVIGIKEFGEKELGLKKTENYETVYLESSKRPIYVVSASPRDRLARITWWFPVVGDMPYLGFFDLDKAKAEKGDLIKKDLDVILGMAEAYSTLGWFKDPVTLNLVEGSTVDLVETILHEMTHTTLYVKGQGEFNEGLAVLVGKVGAYLFLDRTYGPSHSFTVEAKKSIEDERIFCPFLNPLLKRLERLYDSQISYQEKLVQREKIFAASMEDFSRLKGKLQTDRFTRFGRGGMNNAYLMSVGLYHRNFHLFESVLKKKGNSIRDTVAFFKGLSEKEGDILGRARKWVNAGNCSRDIN